MPPDTIVDSTAKILDVGIVGAMCLLLMAVLVVRERFWHAEIKGERAAHDKTRDALLEEVRSNGETIALVRQQMQRQQEAFDTLIKLRKDAA